MPTLAGLRIQGFILNGSTDSADTQGLLTSYGALAVHDNRCKSIIENSDNLIIITIVILN